MLSLTNAAWTLDGAELADRLQLEQGLLLNDFEAQALAVPALRPEWKRQIGPLPAEAAGDGLRLVLGPGTGLGMAALLTVDGRHTPLASESGHSDLGPVGAEEEAFWPSIEKVRDRVSAEAVVSGPGLLRLHNARLASEGKRAPKIDDSALVERALQDRSGEEARSVRAFWRLTARFAGNMALALLPRQGVVLSGGVLPRIAGLRRRRWTDCCARSPPNW
jgi:glucokinase